MLPILGRELLVGKLVRLARPTIADAERVALWQQDMEYLRLQRRGLVYPQGQAQVERWFGDQEDDEHFYPFAIRRLDDDQIVGLLGIKDVMWQSRNCSFFIGIGPQQERGKGYGTDAVRVMLRYCFQELNLYRVGLEVIEYNDAGRTAYARAGFREEGRLRGFTFRDGTYYDVILMSILRPEWEALQDAAP